MSTAAEMPTSARARELAGERDVLLAALEDLELEHAAGDVDDADYETLRAGYVARAARALRAIEDLSGEAAGGADETATRSLAPAPATGRLVRFRRFLGRRRTRRVLGVVGIACALGIVTIAAARLAGVRLPGEDASGTIVVPKAAQVRHQLEQASVLGSTGKTSEAVALYGTILKEVPDQPEALAYRGWLIRLAGIAGHDPKVVRAGDGELAKAARVAPHYADARALDGMALLLDDGQVHPAIAQFNAFLADGPSKKLLRMLGADMAAAYATAHRPVPAKLRPYVRAAKTNIAGAAKKGAAKTGTAGKG